MWIVLSAACIVHAYHFDVIKVLCTYSLNTKSYTDITLPFKIYSIKWVNNHQFSTVCLSKLFFHTLSFTSKGRKGTQLIDTAQIAKYCNAWCITPWCITPIFCCQKRNNFFCNLSFLRSYSPGKALGALKCFIKIFVYNPLVYNPHRWRKKVYNPIRHCSTDFSKFGLS